MTIEGTQQCLKTVDQGLLEAAERLAATPSRLEKLDAELKRLAESLRSVHTNGDSLPRAGSLVGLLRSIQARAARVQLLLDAAVAFYCGAISTLSQTGAYTADGEMPRRANGGHLKLEA